MRADFVKVLLSMVGLWRGLLGSSLLWLASGWEVQYYLMVGLIRRYWSGCAAKQRVNALVVGTGNIVSP